MRRHEVMIFYYKLVLYEIFKRVFQVVKRMWAYIKENNLQDPKNKQMIKCDEKLSKVGCIFKIQQFLNFFMLQVIPTKKFRGFGMTKFLKDHMNVDKE